MNLLESPHVLLSAAATKARHAFVIAFTTVVLALCGVVFGASTAYAEEVVVGSSLSSEAVGIQSRVVSGTGMISITGKNYQSDAFSILDRVNTVRDTASVHKLTWDYELEKVAMQRAAEIAIFYNADLRPDGSSFATLISTSYSVWSENILASTGALDASTANTHWQRSSAHYANMIDGRYTCMGAARFEIDGATYWVEVFGKSNTTKEETASGADGKAAAYNISVLPSNVSLSFASTLPSTVTKGYSMQYVIKNTNLPLAKQSGSWKDQRTTVNASQFTWSSSNTSVASIDTKTGKVIAQAKGSTTITAKNTTLPSLIVSAPSTISIGSKPSAQNPSSGSTSSSTVSTSSSKYKEGWVKSGSRWWYRYSDGSYPTGLKKIGSTYYFFDSKGWMKTGWQHATGNSDWYYFASSGAMKTGWLKTGGKWYYLDSSGKMLTGRQTISGKTYFLNTSGAMHTGWKKEGKSWYYYGSSGAMAKGWIKTGGKWYYLDSSSGAMKTGKFSVGKSVYYADTSGAMQTGWRKLNGKWFYFTGSGAMKTGWLKSGKYWYYLGDDGEMFSGVQALLNKRIYRFKSSGEMVTGWYRESYGWCYYNSSGAMVMDSWIQNKYWVGSSGAMATNSWVDGGRYYVNSKGEWVKGMKK